jgi:hypothetical protein
MNESALEYLSPGERSQPLLFTVVGQTIWSAASEGDRAIVAAGAEPALREATWDRLRTQRRREQLEAMAALFALYAEMGIDAPESVGEILGEIVADAAMVARLQDWEPRRRTIPARVRTLVFRRDGYACVECREDDITQLTLDHRTPVALGGSDDPENLRTLCRRCNSAKGKELR